MKTRSAAVAPAARACNLTRGGLADGGVVGAELKAVHTQAVEAAVRVDAVLRAGVGGRALVHVHARLAVPLQLEAWVAPALQGQKVPGAKVKIWAAV